MYKKANLIAALALAASTAQAQVPQPEVIRVIFPEAASIMALSDNGEWAVACGAGEDQSVMAYPYLINARTGELIQLWDDDNPVAEDWTAYDVTDDGSIVVGGYNGQPAYCDVATKTWTVLPAALKGDARRVTPDGSRIAGWGKTDDYTSDSYTESPFYWERQSDGTYAALSPHNDFANFPRRDDTGRTTNVVRIENMSADGNIVAGAINFTTPATCCYYVYNRTTQTCRYVDSHMASAVNGSFAMQSMLSPDGTWLTGNMYVAEGAEYVAAYRYNTAADTLTLYNATAEEQDRGGISVTNSGVVLASSPAVNPLRYAYVRNNNIWLGLDEILASRYGINFYDRTGFEYTGTVIAVSADEKVLAGMALTSGDGYIIRLGETISEACASVNPLSAYAFSPASGSQLTRFRSVTLAFSKPVTLQSGAQAQLLDAQGNVVRPYNISANADGYSFTIGGMPTQLTAGANYTLRIAAGAFSMTDDASYKSGEITATYIGQADVPVELLQASPVSGTNVSELSTNSPVMMTFSSPIVAADGAVGYLYEEGHTDPISELTLTASGNMLLLAPSLRRYLSQGVAYTVVLPDSSVTDITGDRGNRTVTLQYTGAYQPEISSEGNLFFDDFNDPSQSTATYLLYEGDHNTPNSTAQSLGFDANNTPWNFTLRESYETADFCAASHSMYSPAGTSDDWLSLPQLYIENADYWLSFDAQGYFPAKNDRIEVVVLEEDGGYVQFTSDLYDAFKQRGVTIYSEVAPAGTNQETLEGEWTSANISLAQFAGKNVYIAFVNRNEDQSMLFLDNIRVYYNGDFFFAATTPEVVVAQESAAVGVQVRVSGDDTYNTLTARLSAMDGTYTDTYTATGLNLNNQSGNYTFEFANNMPLNIGKENRFTITLNLDGDSVSQTMNIKNLAFETTKRVVVEEATGQWCGNCPLGMLALENLERLFGDRVIPIAVHGGTGYDLFIDNEYTSYLGFSAWPQGLVNRIDTIYQPMYSAGTFEFNSPTGNQTFLDIAQREFGTIAEAEVHISDALYDTQSGYVRIDGDVTYALDRTGVNNNIAFVVVESGMTGVQNNYFYTRTDENLGEFAAGGAYGTSSPTITFNDVARDVLGDFYGGTSGLVPSNQTAGEPSRFFGTFPLPSNVENWNNAEIVVMLLDANTGRVVNAAKTAFTPGTVSSIDGVSDAQSEVKINALSGAIEAQLPTATDAVVSIYDLSGAVIATAKSHGQSSINIPTNGRSGLLIVNVKADGINTTAKVTVK